MFHIEDKNQLFSLEEIPIARAILEESILDKKNTRAASVRVALIRNDYSGYTDTVRLDAKDATYVDGVVLTFEVILPQWDSDVDALRKAGEDALAIRSKQEAEEAIRQVIAERDALQAKIDALTKVIES